jgi:hypothetical protein
MCTINGMTRVCNKFEMWKLLSQLLWTQGVTQHWRGCSPHKIKLPTSCPNLIFCWIQSREQWNLSKGSNVVICGSVSTLYAICMGNETLSPFHLRCQNKFPSIKGFGISMATSFIYPFMIWAGISMSFSGGGTSPPHRANSPFTRGCAFEHTTTLTNPLPSYQ